MQSQMVGLFLGENKPVKTTHQSSDPTTKVTDDLVGCSFLHESHLDDADEPREIDAQNGETTLLD